MRWIYHVSFTCVRELNVGILGRKGNWSGGHVWSLSNEILRVRDGLMYFVWRVVRKSGGNVIAHMYQTSTVSPHNRKLRFKVYGNRSSICAPFWAIRGIFFV